MSVQDMLSTLLEIDKTIDFFSRMNLNQSQILFDSPEAAERYANTETDYTRGEVLTSVDALTILVEKESIKHNHQIKELTAASNKWYLGTGIAALFGLGTFVDYFFFHHTIISGGISCVLAGLAAYSFTKGYSLRSNAELQKMEETAEPINRYFAFKNDEGYTRTATMEELENLKPIIPIDQMSLKYAAKKIEYEVAINGLRCLQDAVIQINTSIEADKEDAPTPQQRARAEKDIPYLRTLIARYEGDITYTVLCAAQLGSSQVNLRLETSDARTANSFKAIMKEGTNVYCEGNIYLKKREYFLDLNRAERAFTFQRKK
jgi:hypothetical protein